MSCEEERMFTDDQLMKIAMDGAEDERRLALTVIEERSERNALWRRLVGALHKIEGLEKQVAGGLVVKPAPTTPLSTTIDCTGTTIFQKDIKITPVCTCNKPIWMIPPYPPCPVHGEIPCMKMTC
jgi:hypothetical protein